MNFKKANHINCVTMGHMGDEITLEEKSPLLYWTCQYGHWSDAMSHAKKIPQAGSGEVFWWGGDPQASLWEVYPSEVKPKSRMSRKALTDLGLRPMILRK